jgi:hypothetical protein
MMQSIRTHLDLRVPDELVAPEPSRFPVLSVYADWGVSGRGLHEAPTTIRKQLHEASRTILQRGAARDSFDADVERVLAFLDEAPVDVEGLAVFACAGDDLWHVTELATPVPTLAHAGAVPLIAPLARATQDAAPCLVALGDTTTLRLIALDHPQPRELEHLHAHTWGGAHGTSKTGWRRGHVQHAYEVELKRHADRAARAIGDALESAGLHRVAIAGDEVFVPALVAALPPVERARLIGEWHLDMRATVDEVARAIWPSVRERAGTEREREVAAIVERTGADVPTKPEELRDLLVAGRVDTLALDVAVVEAAAAELLLREALRRRSRILMTAGDTRLVAAGGLAAALR